MTLSPLLRLEQLELEGLKAIESLRLPQDGLGWTERIPDILLVGGVNGSGKTSLLEAIFAAAPLDRAKLKAALAATGTRKFLAEFSNGAERVQIEPGNGGRKAPALSASCVFFPSDRGLVLPPTEYKSAGHIAAETPNVWRWTRPERWEHSPEAILYGARWADLNATAEGRPEDATAFEPFAETFATLTGGTRRLIWSKGELKIRTAGGAEHALDTLSSGEKQLLLFGSELRRAWLPGSLILIDEPELHLHDAWLTRLWEVLVRWQGQRGGQLIMATQSSHLFQIAPRGTKLLLRGRR